jgi:hypothetical protein
MTMGVSTKMIWNVCTLIQNYKLKMFLLIFLPGKERAFVDVATGQKARNVINELSEHGPNQIPKSRRLHRVPERAGLEPAEEVQLHRIVEGGADEQLARVDPGIRNTRSQTSSIAAQ